jgi:tRNA1(Val) A37 N6-methylase TrmN6
MPDAGKPGRPAGAAMETSLPELSRDSFHRGAFEVLQPVSSGHRSGSDALLLAASLNEGAKGKLADFGAGAGVAALAALAMNPSLSAMLVELDPTMAQIARKTLALEANAALAGRASVLEADVTVTGSRREKTGLANAHFDHVIMNPPYNHAGQKPSADPLKALAHKMTEPGLEAWMRTAAAILKPGGAVYLIYRAEMLAEVLASMHGRFGGVSIIPLHARPGMAASRIIVRGRRGSRAPLSICPGVVLHEPDNSPSQIAEQLMNGKSRLFEAAWLK